MQEKKKKRYEFEYCVVCKLNHDQGPSHKYIPSHTKSLSAFLTRFQAKLSDVRFFLKNPIPLRPEHASRNRLWCVFCDSDIDELDSSFACGNAINHLANVEHLKNLKHFLWKYGGGMDRVDTFRISEDELAKWEKKCNSLKLEAVPCGEGSQGPTFGPSNEMSIRYPIQDSLKLQMLAAFRKMLLPLLIMGDQVLMREGSQHERMTNEQSSSPVFQNLTQISSMGPKEARGNVHTGAPPPWLQADEEIQCSVPLKRVSGSLVPPSNKSGKSKKLNPNRVGAAWAERRKREMEMEKRGEIVMSDWDASWLPNFGRVWQSGSRKESRKEFELEKQKLPKVESQSDMPIKIQPYISKRMRTDSSQ